MFDLGSVVDLNDAYTAGGVTNTGGAVPLWDALNLDGAVASSSNPSDYYGKYASVFLSQSDLSSIGIGQGSNSVTLAPFAPNVHWQNTPFDSATVPIDIVVKPPQVVPLPAAGWMLIAGLGGLAAAARRRKRN